MKTLFNIVSLGVILALGVVLPASAKDIRTKIGDMEVSAALTLAEGKTLQDPTILLTHGTLAHNKMSLVVSMQKLLAERGLNSLAINLSLGVSGRSGMYDCKVPHKHKHTDAVDEIGHWLKWLKAEGAQNIILMGHSRGGNQTAWFAAERPSAEVKKVVLLAPSYWSEAKAAKGYKAKYGVSHQPILKQAKALAAQKPTQMLPAKTNFVYCKDAQVSAQSFLNYYTADPRLNTAHLIPKIKVPTLVIVGTEDKVVAEMIPATEKIANGKTIQLAKIEEADHFFVDFAGEDAADAIAEFLK